MAVFHSEKVSEEQLSKMRGILAVFKSNRGALTDRNAAMQISFMEDLGKSLAGIQKTFDDYRKSNYPQKYIDEQTVSVKVKPEDQ